MIIAKNTNCQVTGQIARFESKLHFSLWFTGIPSRLLSFPCHLRSECFGKSFNESMKHMCNIYKKRGNFASAAWWEMLPNGQPIVFLWIGGNVILCLVINYCFCICYWKRSWSLTYCRKKKLTNFNGKDPDWVILSKW